MQSMLDRLIKRYLGNVRVRRLLVIATLLPLMLGVLATAWVLLTSGDRVMHAILESTAYGTSQEVERELQRLLQIPDKIITDTINAVESGRVQPSSNSSVFSHLWDKTERGSQFSVSQIYLADPSGRHVGVGSTGIGIPPEQWHFALSGEETFGRMTLFDGSDNGVPGRRITSNQAYDPRTRDWYRNAVTSIGPVWSEVYWDFITGRSTLTRSAAIYNEESLIGVVGVDMYLEHIQKFLKNYPVSDSAEVFIADDNGIMLVSYVPGADDELLNTPVALQDSPFEHIRNSVQFVLDGQPDFWSEPNSVRTHLEIDNSDGYLHITPLLDIVELPWFIGVFVPEDEYHQQVSQQLMRILPWAVAAFLLALFVITAFVHLITRPLKELLKGANRIAVGDFRVNFDTACKNEVGDLARAFDNMRHSLQQAFEQLQGQKRHAESTLTAIADGVVKIDDRGQVAYMNATAERLTGWPSDEAQGQPVETIFKATDGDREQAMSAAELMQLLPEGASHGREATLINRQGESIPIHCRAAAISDERGRTLGTVVAFSDMSDRWRLRTELFRRNTHDSLTDLPNRAEFESRVNNLLQDARENRHRHFLAHLNIDQLRIVNETAGYLAGDQLLREVSRLLQRQFRSGASIARLGADEFAIALEHCDREDAVIRSRSMLTVIESMDFAWNDRHFQVSGTIGLTPVIAESSDAITVLQEAESACFSAKSAGRNRVHVYDSRDEQARLKHEERFWVDRIDEALKVDGFTLYYQSIQALDPAQNPGQHLEVLLRMNGDPGEFISPAHFLPAAERYDLASRIDRWVVENTFAWMAGSTQALSDGDVVAINLSGQSLGDDRFLQFLLQRLKHHDIVASRLCFEVTETASIANLKNALIMMRTLKLQGCRFALDDFGSGLSSFGYLKNLPVDFLKIDGQFVKDMLDDELDFAMVRSINEVGQTMGMKTIAEFVENDRIRDSLKSLGVDFVQGYAIDRPQPLAGLGERQDRRTG